MDFLFSYACWSGTRYYDLYLWSCNEEVEVRVSLKFQLRNMALHFRVGGFFFFFLVDKQLGVFIEIPLMKVSLPNAPYGILKNKL